MFDLIKRYPWLPSLEEYYSDISSKDPLEFIHEVFKSDKVGFLKKRILSIFNAAFENIELIQDYAADNLNIYLYIILRILLYVLDNKSISNRIANLYSKNTYNELNEDRDYNLFKIYQDLNLEVKYEEEPIIYKKRVIKDQEEIFKTKFKIFFIDYLKLASNLKDPYRKLVNNALFEGYVYVKPKNLNRLIQEYVRIKLLTQKKINLERLKELREQLFKNPEFKDLFNEIKNLWEKKKEDFEYALDTKYKRGKDMLKTFPPCIEEILSKAEEGQNLIHIERLYILWFLNALEYPEDEIINVFSKLPDFDREKTEYQVKYAIKKGYTPYSCKSLKSYNLCRAIEKNDELCLKGYYSKTKEKQQEIYHPLRYVDVMEYRNSRKLKNSKKNLEKQNEGS
ncbi:MAG: hypothetical protein JSV23_08410 [Promethearchaeota archaeon]|nr:MAG: hypothetical protein JSV23_08410 [Candidatus Lokiarchaeota archaeon]